MSRSYVEFQLNGVVNTFLRGCFNCNQQQQPEQQHDAAGLQDSDGHNIKRRRVRGGGGVLPRGLQLLALAGVDLIEMEILSRVRREFECRTLDEVVEHYTGNVPRQLRPLTQGGDRHPGHSEVVVAAAAEGDFKALLLLQSHKFDLSLAPSAAAGSGQEECLAALPTLGCDLGLPCSLYPFRDTPVTPAVWAALNGHEGCLRVLMAAGCDLRQVDGLGETLAHKAAWKGHTGCLRLLQGAGCDLGQADDYGCTPAHHAAVGGNEGCLRVLQEAGCDLEQPNRQGETPAYGAAYHGHAGCLRVLHASGCDLRQASNDGTTPLTVFAAEKGHEACLRVLKESGCDLGQTNSAGWAPAHAAACNGHTGCLRLLQEAGCDLGQADGFSLTPADYAVRNGQKDCLRVLVGGWLRSGAVYGEARLYLYV